MIFEKIRLPTSEKIIVRGGSLKLKTTQRSAHKITKKDAFTTKQVRLHTEKKEEKVAKKVVTWTGKTIQSKGLAFGFYFLGILVLILLFLAFRFKLFNFFQCLKSI